LCPYRVVRRLAARLARPTARPRAPTAVIASAVAAAGRRVPGGRNCLAQALAAHVLLGRHGHASRLRLGVARGAAGEFAAHAWVEIDDAVLVGATGRERFTPLPALDGADPRGPPRGRQRWTRRMDCESVRPSPSAPPLVT